MMAELIIGRHTRANMVSALQSISPGQAAKTVGKLVGIGGMVTAGLILSFLQYCGGLDAGLYAGAITHCWA